MRIKNGNLIIVLGIIWFYLLFDLMICIPFEQIIIPEVIFSIQTVIILVAVSPIGEAVNRFIHGGRKIITAEQKEYLDPLFRDVYDSFIENKKRTSKRIKLYIDRSMTINAYAIGSNTIVVTRGAVQMLTPEQLKGVIAHEFGHLHHGDTLLLLVLLGGNVYLYGALLLIQVIKLILSASSIVTGEDQVYGNIGKVFLWLCGLVAAPVIIFLQAAFAIVGRDNEYHADRFAYEVGYGDNLKAALYKLDKLDISDGKLSILERLTNQHPDIDKRIEQLEALTGN